MPLLVFEFLGTTELLVIALVALIIFGPRKLPEIGRTIGRGMAEFKRASEDFKRTWEYEVEVDRREPRAARAARGQLSADAEAERTTDIADWTPDETVAPEAETVAPEAETVARGAEHGAAAPPSAADETAATAPERERV